MDSGTAKAEHLGEIRSRAIRRRLLFVFLIAYSAVLLYGTLWPFNFSLKSAYEKATHSKRIELIPFTHSCPKHGFFCPVDWGTNLPLLAPVAVFFVLLSNPAAGTARRVRKAVLLCFFISLGIETAQLFVPARLTSTTDIVQNTLGAFLAVWPVAWLTRHKPKKET